MHYAKRILSIILVLVMLVGMVPTAAKATGTVTTEGSDVSVEGTNSFGNLLSDALAETEAERETGEEDDSGGYGITALTIEGNVATVTYEAMEEATLLVAIYTEDGMQLVNSGKTTVSADATEADVTIEGEMPQYFEASAFLLDTYDLSPLCQAYATPMYTQEMQALLNSTVSTYEEAGYEVLNLDEDESTNFAVYHKSVAVIDYVEGCNTVTTVDDENYTYVIENCDEQITSLTAGMVLAYPYGEENLLLVKIKAMEVVDGTATIYGMQMDIEEVFDYMKIETASVSEGVTVNDSVCDEGVTFDGITYEGAPATRAWSDDIELKTNLAFTIEKEFMTEGDNQVGAKISGTLNLKPKATLSYYISLKRQFVEAKVRLGLTSDITFTGVLKITGVQLAEFTLPSPIAGVEFECEPHLVWQFEASSVLKGDITVVLGFGYDSDKGWQNLCEKPSISLSSSMEGKVFFGVALESAVCVLDDDIASIGFTFQNGFQVTGKMTGTDYEGDPKPNASKIHTCDSCLALRLDFVRDFSIWLKFVKVLKIEHKFETRSLHLGDMYWSFDPDNKGSAFTKCPHYEYRVTVKVQDKAGNIVEGQEVFLSTGKSLGKTGEKGTLAVYLPKDEYTFQTTIGEETLTVDRKVSNATRVVLTNNPEVLRQLNALEALMIKALKFEVNDTYPESEGGKGTFASGVTWKIYRSGYMVIEGDGEMDDFDSSSIPWKSLQNKIKAVEFKGDISNVGNYAFYGCANLKTVILEETTKEIGSNAFAGCSGLREIRLPVDYVYASNSFTNCTNVDKIQYRVGEEGIMPDRQNYNLQEALYYRYSLEYVCAGSLQTVIFEDGITNVAAFAFADSVMLQEVYLADSVSSIGDYAFQGSGIETLALPEALTTIGASVFANSALTTIEFPDTLETVGSYAFERCTGLTEVVIPDTVSDGLGSGAFEGCTGLKKVTLPADYTLHVYGSFIGCTNVEQIHYTPGATGVLTDRQRDNVNALGYFTKTLEYQSRASLKQVTFEEGIVRVGNYAFYEDSALTDVELPSTLLSIGEWAFCNTGVTQMTLPPLVNSIGYEAFSSSKITQLLFTGDAPSIHEYGFRGMTATVYYPEENGTWTAEVRQAYGGTVTWQSYTPSSTAVSVSQTVEIAETKTVTAPVVQTETIQMVTVEKKKPATRAVFGGEYTSVEIDGQVVYSAFFAGLVPGEEYVMIAIADLEAEDLLAESNLLAIFQAAAEEDGTLIFDYVPRQQIDVSYVFAAGATHWDLNDAVISFPPMTESSQPQDIQPTVVYNGKELTEEVDYIIVGDVDYTEAGEYTCYIRGVREYTGLVECRYAVAQANVNAWNVTLGDNVAVNFRLAISDAIAETATATITAVGKTETVTSADATKDPATGEWLFTVELAAAQMTEEILVEVANGETQIVSKTYSVRGYADYILDEANGFDETTKALVTEMLHYGGAAQAYFGCNTENYANAGIDAGLQTVLPEEAPSAMWVGDYPEDWSLYGVTMLFESHIALRFYYTADETFLLTVKGEKLEPMQKDGMYYVQVGDIAPHQLAESVQLQVNDTTCVVYSPMNYIIRMYQKTEDTALQQLLLAMYRYHLAALDYCA